MFYHYFSKFEYINVINIYGVTQDPNTQELIIIMAYCKSDLTHYITKDFYNISWSTKMYYLYNIIDGVARIHDTNIIHRDLHSGNILLGENHPKICDLGLSKSATESTDDDEDDEIYGIIPYVAPEVFQGKEYTKYSDIYSFGMIMWELMTGR